MFYFCYRVVHVHSRHGQQIRARQLVQPMYAGDALLDNALEVVEYIQVMFLSIISQIASIIKQLQNGIKVKIKSI